MRWDIFCKVIDNHGDIGVCWRLSAELARRGQQVRLWVDDPSALAWMAPAGCSGVEVIHWNQPATASSGDVVVEAFGCELDDTFVASMAARTRERGRQPAWINLEYLSAEAYVERCHGLPSPVLSGPARGLTKRFFYPGFTLQTGGLLREADLAQRQQTFDANQWLLGLGIEARQGERRVSLFCYEPAVLPELLAQLQAGGQPTRLLVTAGRAQSAVRAALRSQGLGDAAGAAHGQLSISYLPWLSQLDYDHLLWSCDLNFVRGEDSLVRALWARRPFVWHIYPQQDDAHHLKLAAFLRWLKAPRSLQRFHEWFNGTGSTEMAPLLECDWQHTFTQAYEQLLAQPDLATELLAMASRHTGIITNL